MPKRIALALLAAMLSLPSFAAESTEPEPYGKDEFPQWARSVRRLEIITAGSLPFTVLISSMSYNLLGKPNFFSDDKDIQVCATGAVASAALGVTDFVIEWIFRYSKEKRLKKELEARQIWVEAIGADGERSGPPPEWLKIRDGSEHEGADSDDSGGKSPRGS